LQTNAPGPRWLRLSLAFMRCGVYCLILIFLAGCFWPHTTLRSGQVTGRVLDARCHIPIKGVEVGLIEPPHHRVFTNTNGYFRLQAVRQFHYGYVPPEGEWPQNKDHTMKVSHPGYTTIWRAAGYNGSEMGDILLVPGK